MEEKDIILQQIKEANPYKLVLSNKADKSYEYRKIEIIKSISNKKECYQISCYTEKQVFQKNVELEKIVPAVEEFFPIYMKQLNAFCEDREIAVKETKSHKLLVNTTKTKTTDVLKRKTEITHNRQKNYIINEGELVPPLVDMGIFTKEGKVVKSMYDKYKQINRFVELVDDVLKNFKEETVNIIDFGCGKSYLTFILYYYLVEKRHKKAHIVGLDLKADVIKHCNEAAKKYAYDGLRFELGDINGYKTDRAVDMVVTLHACDTATDYALFNAVSWNARYILSVPCCQHELNNKLNSNSSDELKCMLKYGIIKERMAALVTDSIRANMLTYRGYKTQLLEFVDLAHSPKNILIRAVKSNIGADKKQEAFAEVEAMNNLLGVDTTIYKLLT